jgi:3-deoxy-D-manno-octulosonic-acid transferase
MLYSLLYTLAMLLAGPVLLLNGKTRAKYLPSLKERLGFHRRPMNPEGKPAVWIHAVSVGEVLAAQSLVAALRRRLPGYLVLVSSATVTGRETALSSLQADGVFYFPYDWKFAVRRTLKLSGARLCVVMETELWPNFIRVLSRKGVPLLLANGRISDRSFKRYRRFRFFFGPLLRRYHTLCAQSALDADRLVAIGAYPRDVLTTGNLKYRREQFEVSDGFVDRLRRVLRIEPGEPVFLAGSTHEGEEAAALEAFRVARRSLPRLRFILVPRKPERFDKVASMMLSEGLDFERYTVLEGKPRRADIVLIDAIGLLKGLYHLANVAFVGGSLAPVGGHNLLEACAAGVPVLFGPHMSNFRSVAEDVLRCGAGRRVEEAGRLAEALQELLTDERERARMSRNSRVVLEGRQEALPRTVEAIRAALFVGSIQRRPSVLLRSLARLHAGAAGLFRRSPESELRKAPRLNTPVISIGGLSFGGAAKTPMTALLAGELQARGHRVAVLTRGYRGRGPEPMVVADGKNVMADSEAAGDEALLIARSVPGVIVIRDRRRLTAGRLAEELFGPTVFLLDDGFQHRKLARNFSLLMLDAESVLGGRSPEQLLREPLRFSSSADAVVLLGAAGPAGDDAAGRLRAAGALAPIFGASYIADGCYDLRTREPVDLGELSELKPLAFCGIASPARFAASLLEVAVQPPGFRAFPDHHRFTGADMRELAELLKETAENVMITTEKDAQRLSSLAGLPGNVKILVLKVRLQIERFEELFALVEQSITK